MRIVFMGSSEASAECLHAILREEALEVVGVVTQPDRPVGRGKAGRAKEIAPCPLAKFAAARGLTEIIKPERVNDDEPMAWIRAKKPDVIAALEAGDRLTGVTVMRMGVGLDDGPIMLQSFEPIYPDTTGGDLMEDLAIAGGVALAKALKLLWRHALPPEVPQDAHAATYVKKLKKTDGLVSWDCPVIEIERRIRAYNPWPGCYTFLPLRFRKKGTFGRLVISRAKIVRIPDAQGAAARPGTVIGLDRLGPIVKCHDTALLLTEVKPEGSSAMDGGAFLRGRPLKPFEDCLLCE